MKKEAMMDPTENALDPAQPSKARRVLGRIGAAAACLLPGAVLGFTFYSLIFGSLRLNWGSFLLLILAPALILVRLLLLFHSGRKALDKALRAVVWSLLTLCWFFVGVSLFSLNLPLEYHRVYRQDALEEFTTRQNSWFVKTTELLSELDPGQPEEIALHRCSRIFWFFETDADILLCRYTPEAYAAEKAALERSLSYRTEPMYVMYYEDGTTGATEPTVRLGNDEFRFLDSGPDLALPFFKTSGITVTNDETCEIAFIYYTDTEADGIDSMTRFLEEECFWNWIR